jgi:hypothetical protein
LLEGGSLPQLRWLFKHYPLSLIREIFQQQGARLLSPRSRRFWSWWLRTPEPRLPPWRETGRRWGGAP